jgi:hypothetical protein
VRILQELDDYKLPALAQSGAKLHRDGLIVVLFSRSGFTKGLRDAAQRRHDLRLVELGDLVPSP